MVLGTILISMKPCGAGSLKSKRTGNEIYTIYMAKIKAVAEFHYQILLLFLNLLRKPLYL